MSADRVNQAIQLIREGNTNAAGKILAEVVKQDPKNETAWLWLAGCFEGNDKKKFCLKKALEINPDNQKAWQALDRLTKEEMAWQSRLDVALEKDNGLGLDQGFNMDEKVYGENPLKNANGTPYTENIPRGAEYFETKQDPAAYQKDEAQFEKSGSFTGIFVIGFLTIIGVIAAFIYLLISRGILFPPSIEKTYAKDMRAILPDINSWQDDLAQFNTSMNAPYSGVLSATGGSAMTAENALFAYLALLGEPSEEISSSDARNELNNLLGPNSTTALQNGTTILAAMDLTEPPQEVLPAHQGVYSCMQQELRRVQAVNQIVTSGVRTGFTFSTEACETLADNLAVLQRFTRDN